MYSPANSKRANDRVALLELGHAAADLCDLTKELVALYDGPDSEGSAQGGVSARCKAAVSGPTLAASISHSRRRAPSHYRCQCYNPTRDSPGRNRSAAPAGVHGKCADHFRKERRGGP